MHGVAIWGRRKVNSSRQIGEDQNSKYHWKGSEVPISSLLEPKGVQTWKWAPGHTQKAPGEAPFLWLQSTLKEWRKILSFSFFYSLESQLPDNSVVTKLAVGACKHLKSWGRETISDWRSRDSPKSGYTPRGSFSLCLPSPGPKCGHSHGRCAAGQGNGNPAAWTKDQEGESQRGKQLGRPQKERAQEIDPMILCH